jgi:hypothetical protein
MLTAGALTPQLDILLSRGLTIALVVQMPDLLIPATTFFSLSIAFTVMRLFWWVRQAAAQADAASRGVRVRGLFFEPTTMVVARVRNTLFPPHSP